MNTQDNIQTNIEDPFMPSRRRMIAMSLLGGTAALLAGAKSAQATTYTPTTPVYVPRSVTDPAFGTDLSPAKGAVPNDSTYATHNTAVFRKACASYLADYQTLQSGALQNQNPIEVFVPAGTWYLQDGFTVPLGCQLRGAGMGATWSEPL